MIVVERQKIELDYCPGCHGAWFDAGEMELLLAALGVEQCATFIDDVLKKAGAGMGEKPRRCPICALRMHKAHMGPGSPVVIDACRRGDGIWFDGGELERLLTDVKEHTATGPECDLRIEGFLKETLGPAGKQ
jgi:Zn-finger nucleic acid-binding protein